MSLISDAKAYAELAPHEKATRVKAREALARDREAAYAAPNGPGWEVQQYVHGMRTRDPMVRNFPVILQDRWEAAEKQRAFHHYTVTGRLPDDILFQLRLIGIVHGAPAEVSKPGTLDEVAALDSEAAKAGASESIGPGTYDLVFFWVPGLPTLEKLRAEMVGRAVTVKDVDGVPHRLAIVAVDREVRPIDYQPDASLVIRVAWSVESVSKIAPIIAVGAVVLAIGLPALFLALREVRRVSDNITTLLLSPVGIAVVGLTAFLVLRR